MPASDAQPGLPAFQLEVARLFFALPASRGFLLAGGAALLAQHGLVPARRRRPRRRGLGRRQGTCGAGRRQRPGREITAQAGSAGLSASACVRYLSARHEHLCYDQALANGWPIATGVIEGACRHLIADRLDIGGARWGLDGAEAVLTLRAVISNGDFEEYWQFHLECEHQRLYPGTKQGKYALGA